MKSRFFIAGGAAALTMTGLIALLLAFLNRVFLSAFEGEYDYSDSDKNGF